MGEHQRESYLQLHSLREFYDRVRILSVANETQVKCMEMFTDHELLLNWQKGNLRAGNELFDRHYHAVRRFFCNKCGDVYEDLVQRTFVACIENAHRFCGRSSFRTYLFGIAHNVLKGHLRHIAGPQGRIDYGVSSIYDFSPSPSSVLHQRREQVGLYNALRRIAIDYQVILELYYWENLCASELAKVLELSEGCVRSRLRRAKRKLYEHFAREKSSSPSSEVSCQQIDVWMEQLRNLRPPCCRVD